MSNEPRKRGRPLIHDTPERRAAAKAKWRKASKLTTRNVTVDADLVKLLNDHADELAEAFGFRPTISQTLRHLLKAK